MLDPLTPEELEFIQAVETYKARHGRAYLAFTEILRILKAMGYRRAADPRAAGPRGRGARGAREVVHREDVELENPDTELETT